MRGERWRGDALRWTAALDDEVWADYLAGRTSAQSATRLGLRESQVANRRHTLRQRRPERPDRGLVEWTPKLERRVWDLWSKRGWSARDISAKTGLTEAQISARIQRWRAEKPREAPPRREVLSKAAKHAIRQAHHETPTERSCLVVARAGHPGKTAQLYLNNYRQRLRDREGKQPSLAKQAQMTPFEVNAVRAMLADGLTQVEIARRMNCSREAVSAIKTGRNARKVPNFFERLGLESSDGD